MQVESVGREKEEEAELGQEGEEYYSDNVIIVAGDSALHVQPVRGGLPGERLSALSPPDQGTAS